MDSGHSFNHRRKVLVLSDNEGDGNQLRLVLRKAGFVVYQHNSAIGTTRAIVQYEATAIVISLKEPGASCDRLVAMLRSNSRLQTLAIVVVSDQGGLWMNTDPYSARVDAVLLSDEAYENLPAILNRLLQTQARFAQGSTSGSYPAIDASSTASGWLDRDFSQQLSRAEISGMREAVRSARSGTSGSNLRAAEHNGNPRRGQDSGHETLREAAGRRYR